MKDNAYYLEKNAEYGIVEKVEYPLIFLMGFKDIHHNELVISEDGELGVVFSIDSKYVEVLLFSQNLLKVGTQFARTGEYISVPVTKNQLGKVIDPLGQTILGEAYDLEGEVRYIDGPIKGISERVRIKTPFETGVSLVDMIIPIGKGQKELIIGDRKSGKTSLLLNIMKKQAQNNTIIIYAGIGRKKNDIKKLYEFCKLENILPHVIIIAATSDSSPNLIYLAPYSAMTLAEYFRDNGQDVVVIFDDLSTHAKYYREISLVAQHFPGRESYPGDIFYSHAKLLERAGNFRFETNKEVSITCFPVAETVESDLSGFIPTNIMGMTDGHIFFDNNAFYKGLRPAININLSVTRVGKQTQTHLQREINREISAFLSQYEKMETYSHFGAELSTKVQKMLLKGDLLYGFFQQHYTEIIPLEVQLIMIGMIWSSMIEDKAKIVGIRKKLIKETSKQSSLALFKKITSVNTMYDFQTNLGLYKDQILKMVTVDSSITHPVSVAKPLSTGTESTK